MKRTLAVFLAVIALWPLHPLDVFWERPIYDVAPEGARFIQAAASAGRIIVAWQEHERSAEAADRFRTSIRFRTSSDGVSWNPVKTLPETVDIVGSLVSVFSMAAVSSGELHFAILQSANRIVTLTTRDEGATFARSQVDSPDETVLTPRVFGREAGGLVLFLTKTRSVAGAAAGDADRILTVYYTTSRDGGSWAETRPLISDPVSNDRFRLSFLPSFSEGPSEDYVVFQGEERTQRGVYQLLVSRSEDAGRTWSRPVIITDAGALSALDGGRAYTEVDNQRPFSTVRDGELLVAWERRRKDSLIRNIYTAVISKSTLIARDFRVVNRGVRDSGFPRVVVHDDGTIITWFEDVAGGERVVWTDFDKPGRPVTVPEPPATRSIFAFPLSHRDHLYMLWENAIQRTETDRTHRVGLLRPDLTVSPPAIVRSGFVPGQATAETRVRLRWRAPEDVSGVDGFAYRWTPSRIDRFDPRRLATLPGEADTIELEAAADGSWFFQIAARDRAGNWSDPATVEYVRDLTPPAPVDVAELETDAAGFLSANTFTIRWRSKDEPDIAGYRYAMRYLGEVTDAPEATTGSGAGLQLTRGTDVSFANIDDGLWEFAVAPVDVLGNVGETRSLRMKLDKYVPVTFVSFVDAERDELGRVSLAVQGRGFAVGGSLQAVILDRDGAEPFDYVYQVGSFSVRGDRLVAGPVVEDVESGNYRVGVRHPLRGVAFSGQRLAIEDAGTIKYGDFTVVRRTSIEPVRPRQVRINGTDLIVVVILGFLAAAAVVAARRTAVLIGESREIQMEVRAILWGAPMPAQVRAERIRRMKQRGLSLRIKFTLFISTLVIAVVLMVSIPIAYSVTSQHQRILAEGLQKRAGVLLDSMATGARNNLPFVRNRELVGQAALALQQVPAQISALEEAQYATITGIGARLDAAADNPVFVWGSNDPDLAAKSSTPELEAGITELIEDDLARAERGFRATIEAKAAAQLTDVLAEMGELARQAAVVGERTGQAAGAELADINRRFLDLNQKKNNALADIANDYAASLPAFSAERFDPAVRNYIFYKPVLSDFRVSAESTIYYLGLVRLEVSTETIIRQIDDARLALVLLIGGIAVVALVIGILGALVLSSITVIPIMKLVRGVEKIRDTEDKAQLAEHRIEIRTRDEIAELAETVNQMTQGLVIAATTAKELSVGKDVQKQFLPLNKDKAGRKQSIAVFENDDVELFAYYEGAKDLSGDYFEMRPLEKDGPPVHFAVAKCDVSGKGAPAALIMIQVAALVSSYFSHWVESRRRVKEVSSLVDLAHQVNDVLYARGFSGLFAAYTMGILDGRTGKLTLTHAGDRDLNMYDGLQGIFVKHRMDPAPAAGAMDPEMVRMAKSYREFTFTLKRGDIAFFVTDGVDEARRFVRDRLFNTVTGEKGLLYQELTHDRFVGIVEAVMKRVRFRLEKQAHPDGGEAVDFDFSACEPTARDAILAVVSVERMFRISADPGAGAQDRVRVDRYIDEFLKKHLKEYTRYFAHPVETDVKDQYVYFSHLKSDEQYDDLTLLAVRKK